MPHTLFPGLTPPTGRSAHSTPGQCMVPTRRVGDERAMSGTMSGQLLCDTIFSHTSLFSTQCTRFVPFYYKYATFFQSVSRLDIDYAFGDFFYISYRVFSHYGKLYTIWSQRLATSRLFRIYDKMETMPLLNRLLGI